MALVYTVLIIAVMAIFAITLSAYISQRLEKRTESGLVQRLDILVETMSSYHAALSDSTVKIASVFQSHFPAEFSLDHTRSITINGIKTPLLKNGSVLLNLDNSIVDRFTVITKAVGSVFVRSGDDFIRVTTSLKKEDGSRAVGTLLERDNPAYEGLLKGVAYVGKAELFGKDYMTSYQPVKDSRGNVIAVLLVGLDFTENLKGLKDKIRNTKIGESGYIFVLDTREGRNYGKLQIHPAKEGSNVADSKDSKGHEFIREILTKKDGIIRYPWANRELGETRLREKLVAYRLFKEWNWIVCAGSWKDELNQFAGTILKATVGATLLVTFTLVLIFRAMLREEKRFKNELRLRIDAFQESQEELQATEEMLRAQVDEYIETHDQLMATEEMLQVHLREAEEISRKFKAVFENSPIGIALVNTPEGTFYEVNQVCLNMFGYEPEAVIGKSTADLNVWQNQEDRNHFLNSIQDNGFIQNFEVKMNRNNGVEITILLSGNRLEISGNSFILIAFQEITEQKLLQSQLQQSQKMEAVGRLAGGVAHDFNNMLGVILGYAELTLMTMVPSNPVYSNICEISSAAARSADLTRQLLAFARKQTITPRVIDLNETVSGTLKMLKRLIGEDIDLIWRPAPALWPVKADPSQVDQMLANLCVNSRDAIAEFGKMTIETENRVFGESYCSHNLGFIPGEYVRLSVSDDGIGMDKETVTHIFEPFYTTKELGKGTGLGLATVYGIVKQNSGFINVYSEPGQGTTFTIYLPRHIGESMDALNKVTSEQVPCGSETILLVEDEPSILKTTALMLEGQGYRVLTAGTAAEAIQLFKEQIGKVQMLMSDVVMPDMNGRDLAKELRSFNPQLNCLFMSGYTADVIARHGVLEEGVYFIQKPFSLSDLASKVREVIDGN
jgi:PAS domain S-box-containing protein